eukprot:scaffold164939_cov40-Tisochrysis_lutea.AAC.1
MLVGSLDSTTGLVTRRRVAPYFRTTYASENRRCLKLATFGVCQDRTGRLIQSNQPCDLAVAVFSRHPGRSRSAMERGLLGKKKCHPCTEQGTQCEGGERVCKEGIASSREGHGFSSLAIPNGWYGDGMGRGERQIRWRCEGPTIPDCPPLWVVRPLGWLILW